MDIKRYLETLISVMAWKARDAHDSANEMEDDYDSYNAGWKEGLAAGLDEAVRTLKCSEFLTE